jgi:hypothetical protein
MPPRRRLREQGKACSYGLSRGPAAGNGLTCRILLEVILPGSGYGLSEQHRLKDCSWQVGGPACQRCLRDLSLRGDVLSSDVQGRQRSR